MREKKKWFYRLLFSYLPVLLVVSSILIVSFFLFIVKVSQKEADKANDFLVQTVMSSVDSALRSIDHTVMQDIESDKVLAEFFSGGRLKNPYYLNYEVEQRLSAWINAQSLIESAYAVRWSDGLIVTTASLEALDDFNDKAFIQEERYKPTSSLHWTAARSDPLFPAKEVSTLARKVSLLSGGQGMIVVNVRTDAIQRMLKDNEAFRYGSLTIAGIDGTPILRTDEGAGELRSDGSEPQSSARSEYTGWVFASSVKNSQGLAYVSIASYVWIALAMAMTLLGSAWVFFITRRNYKPIETVLNRIRSLPSRKSPLVQSMEKIDEFAIIGSTFEELLGELETYGNQSRKNAHLRRKYLFFELMEGTSAEENAISGDDDRSDLDLPSLNGRLIAAIAEIDRFHRFSAAYSDSDQNLLRYLLVKVAQEIADPSPFDIWCEWMSDNRLALLVIFDPDASVDPLPAVNEYWGLMTDWIERYLDFTMTFGVGMPVTSPNDLPISYRTAEEMLWYKWLHEHRRILIQEDLGWTSAKSYFEFQHFVHSLVHSFRVGDDEWLLWFDKLFADVRNSLLARDDMVKLLSYLLFNLDKELSLLGIGPIDAINAIKEEGLASLREAIEGMEFVTDIQASLRTTLLSLAERVRELRESQKHHHVIHQVKTYIEEQFRDPDLSLASISEKFGLSGTYLSKLFKEDIGDTFVNYLIGFRIANAKSLLIETDDSIQSIAGNVGYIHAVSFNRAFKKMEGMTPGEYRSRYDRQ